MKRSIKNWFIKPKKASQRLDTLKVLYCSHFGMYNLPYSPTIPHYHTFTSTKHKFCSTNNWKTVFLALQNTTSCIKIGLYLQCEQYYSNRNEDLKTEFDWKAHILNQLDIGSIVAIYDTQQKNKICCQKTATIVEVLWHKQYKVKLNGTGRITLHNKRFLRFITPQSTINPIPSATVTIATKLEVISNPAGNVQRWHSTLHQEGEMLSVSSTDPLTNPSGFPATICETETSNWPPAKTQIVHYIPQALRNLANFNKRGLKEWRNRFHRDINDTLPHRCGRDVVFYCRYSQWLHMGRGDVEYRLLIDRMQFIYEILINIHYMLYYCCDS